MVERISGWRAWMPALIAALLVAVVGLMGAGRAGAAEDVRLVSEPLLAGLIAPTALTQTPSGSFLVAEKRGPIYEWTPGDAAPRLVVDVSPLGLDLAQTDGDRAVLGLVADPGYDDPGSPGHRRIYFTFISRLGPPGVDMPQPGSGCALFDCPARGVVAAAVIPDTGAAESVEIIHDKWCTEDGFHPAGDLVWTPDGQRLYASFGDGIDSRVEQPDYWDYPGDPCDDPPGFGGPWKAQHAVALDEPNGQEGSVLSFSLDEVRDPAAGTDPVLVATGLRNPWRMAVDPVLGDLYTASVGWFEYEEVDRVPAADIADGVVHNSGWPCTEGPSTDASSTPTYYDHPYCVGLRAADGADEPWLFYGDGSGPDSFDVCPVGRSVGTLLPIRSANPLPLGLGAGLLIVDFVRGCAWTASRPAPGQPYSNVEPRHIPADLTSLVDAVQGADGDIYWLAIATDGGAGLGRLNRLRVGAVAHIRVTPAAEAGGTAFLSGAESLTSAEPTTLEYAWDLDDDGQFDDATGALAEIVVPDTTPVPVALRVTDALGRSHVTRSRAVVGTAPFITLESEPADDVVRGDTEVTVQSIIFDPDRDATADQTTWSVEIEHCPNVCHTHPILSTSGSSITFTAAPHDTLENSFYRVVARNVDSAGLETVTSREVRVSDPFLPPEEPGPGPAGPEPPIEEPPLLPPTTPPTDDRTPQVVTPPLTPVTPPAPSVPTRAAPVALVAPTRTAAPDRAGLVRVVHRIRVRGTGRYRLVLQNARTGRTLVQFAGSGVGATRLRRAVRVLGTVIRPADLGPAGARALLVTSLVRPGPDPVRLVVRRQGGPAPRGAVVRGSTVRALG